MNTRLPKDLTTKNAEDAEKGEAFNGINRSTLSSGHTRPMAWNPNFDRIFSLQSLRTPW